MKFKSLANIMQAGIGRLDIFTAMLFKNWTPENNGPDNEKEVRWNIIAQIIWRKIEKSDTFKK